jgi:hypothetical protein
MHVRGAGVVLLLLVFIAVAVSVDQTGVIVLVAVVTRTVLEFAERTAGVTVRHVVVVVCVDLRRMGMFVFFVADDVLRRAAAPRVHGHCSTSLAPAAVALAASSVPAVHE